MRSLRVRMGYYDQPDDVGADYITSGSWPGHSCGQIAACTAVVDHARAAPTAPRGIPIHSLCHFEPACSARSAPRPAAVRWLQQPSSRGLLAAVAGLNKYSSRITQPKSQGASQAMLYATGEAAAALQVPLGVLNPQRFGRWVLHRQQPESVLHWQGMQQTERTCC